MTASRRCLVVLGAVWLLGVCFAKPANDLDRVTDVHLNSVLPEGERAPAAPAPLTQDNSTAARLELMSEEQDDAPGAGPEVISQRPSYFSRLIQSIFDIPISILESVRNLMQTTARRT